MSPEAKKKRNEYMAKWREKNRDHLKKYQREWRRKNKAKIRQYQEEYWERQVKKGPFGCGSKEAGGINA